jgi:hypothetical protein
MSTCLIALIQQAATFDWQAIFDRAKDDPKQFAIPLAHLLTDDNPAIDRQHGICPVPLYEFGQRDWELLLSGENLDDVEDRLRQLGIYQYFFPPPDHIALGLADRGASSTASAITAALGVVPDLGHRSAMLKSWRAVQET